MEVCYRANDGKVFDTACECKEYEKEQVKAYFRCFDSHGKTVSEEDAIVYIIEDTNEYEYFLELCDSCKWDITGFPTQCYEDFPLIACWNEASENFSLITESTAKAICFAKKELWG